jgi:hypothetical protein
MAPLALSRFTSFLPYRIMPIQVSPTCFFAAMFTIRAGRIHPISE